MMATEMPAAPGRRHRLLMGKADIAWRAKSADPVENDPQADYVPDPIGTVSFAPPQIVFRRHSQMLDKEPHYWANAAVFQHDDRDRPWFRG